MPLVVPGVTPASKKAEHAEDDKKPKAQHFQAHPGPAIPEDKSAFEKTPSKEEQHARAQELNEGKQ
ncbi:hypothetical protein EX30DRAFT_339630 [Ascodesmis nigricans]|uniref:Uncharacterized protein n=1 Tax=Ascodesmis nigricans TaxID=341454 RepID=A0A4S2MZT6_9PEZI|nr:hypothetical protein EX30DRAFT_339630 [Ascodesmis nigricans]